MNTPSAPDEVRALRSRLEAFFAERLEARLEKTKDPGEQARLALGHQREAWLADAARRASQIQLVTHALKFAHPDARGSSIYTASGPCDIDLVDSAGQRLPDDVVGNAAALDVFKLLRLEHEGRTVLERVLAGEASIAAAFSDDTEQGRRWCEAFAAVVQSRGPPASHTLAKQVYFPLADGGYHLLAPLYPTGMAHVVHQHIEHHRFSEDSKTARDARRAGKPHAGYREYPNLAARAFGGSNSQNISQLNSERRGLGYLLPSCPPHWQDAGLKPPARVTTIFGRWLTGFAGVRDPVHTLRDFLARTAYNNLAIREARRGLVEQVVDAVLYLTGRVKQLPPGWSGAPDCRLRQDESLWLDPGRAENDADFAAAREQGLWRDAVGRDFASWFNQQLRTDRTPMDADAAREWQREFERAHAEFERELSE